MESTDLGRRLREVRSWRQLSVRAVAELSGISYSYLAKIERGAKPVNSRQVLEALAQTLRVSPAELTGRPYAPVDPIGSEAQASLGALEAVRTEWWPDARLSFADPSVGAQLRGYRADPALQ
jgi:transcriptional regulator with XRE-family HTH domain